MSDELPIEQDIIAQKRRAEDVYDERFERRYKLLELKERRADRELKRQELQGLLGRGIKLTSAQATVAASALALFSALIGALIQGVMTRDVEAGKSQALIEVEGLKATANIELEKQKQDAVERLDRAKFETTLILKATESPKRDDQIRNLKFFLDAGFIRDPDGKLAKMDVEAYPSLPPPSTYTPADMYNDAKSSIGHVSVNITEDGTTFNNTGSCFVISKDGYAIMAGHIFEKRTVKSSNMKINVRLSSRYAPILNADLVKIDNELDIAIIKLPGSNYIPLRITQEQPKIGEPIKIIGYSAHSDLEIRSGVVSLPNGPEGRFVMDALVSIGFSGSPVLNSGGSVLGVLIGQFVDNGGTVAVPARNLKSLLSEIAPN